MGSKGNTSLAPQIATAASLTASLCSGLYLAKKGGSLLSPQGLFLADLSFFHLSEYLHVRYFTPHLANMEAFLLHIPEYWAALLFSEIEYWIEAFYFPRLKKILSPYLFPVGVVMIIAGSLIRKVGMLTAGREFTHEIAVQKPPGHRLITHGIYRFSRHPGYLGWFYWAVGTQVLLANPVSALLYAYVSWNFFSQRIRYEEDTLVRIYGKEYLEYRRRVPVRIPLIG